MAHVGHHARQASHVFFLCQIDDGDATAAAHAADEQIFVVRREDRSAEGIAASVVSVHGRGEAVVQREHMVNDDAGFVFPFVRIRRGDVDESDRVVSPVSHGNGFSVSRSRNHFGQRSCLHEFHDFVGLRVNDGECRRVLCVDVVTASVVGHPKVSSVVGEGAFHRLSHEVVVFGIVCKRIEWGGCAPEFVVSGREVVFDDLQFAVCFAFEDHGRAAFQGVHVVFLSVRMNVHGFRRVDGFIACVGGAAIVLTFADELDGQFSVVGNDFFSDVRMHHGWNAFLCECRERGNSGKTQKTQSCSGGSV